jgi:hypothetical protein
VRIAEIEDDVRATYLSYLKTFKKKGGRPRERKQALPTPQIPTKSTAAQAGTLDAITPASINNAFEQFLDE